MTETRIKSSDENWNLPNEKVKICLLECDELMRAFYLNLTFIEMIWNFFLDDIIQKPYFLD